MLSSTTLSAACLLAISSVITAQQLPSNLTSGSEPSKYSLSIGYQGHSVSTGAILRLSAVQDAPSFALDKYAGGGNFTIVMIDLDARPNATAGSVAPLAHMIQTDLSVHGKKGSDDLTSDTEAALPYLPPMPAQGTGKHRYAFLLYLQPKGKFVPTDVPGSPVTERVRFDLAGSAEANGLGQALAGACFPAQSEGTNSTSSASATPGGVSSSSTASASANRTSPPTSSSSENSTLQTASVALVPKASPTSTGSGAGSEPGSTTKPATAATSTSGASRLSWPVAAAQFGLGAALAGIVLLM